jgi:hypothetical protein
VIRNAVEKVEKWIAGAERQVSGRSRERARRKNQGNSKD